MRTLPTPIIRRARDHMRGGDRLRFARRSLVIGGVVLAAAATLVGCSNLASRNGTASPGRNAAVSVAPPTQAAVQVLAPVPAELRGTWEPTEKVTGTGPLLLNLVFSEHSFAFYDDDITAAAIGRAWAAGADQIALGTRGPCDSVGTYTWKLAAGQLTLSGGADDQCRRRDPLVSRVWRKVSDSTRPADTDLTQ